MKHSLKDWIFATRPWSLTASSMPALIAISYIFFIRNEFDTCININWWFGLIALVGAVIFQVGGNLLNDYFDYKYNVDRKDTYSSRTLVDGYFFPKEILYMGIVFLSIGAIIGIYLLINTGWHLLWIGALGLMGTYFYNKMKYIALGDIVIFLIYGLLIGLGVVYVMTGELIWQILLVTSPVGFLIVGILHANNTRDILNDKKANIQTQAMLFGLKGSKMYFVILMLGSYLWILGLLIFKILPPLNLFVIGTLPLTMKCVKQMSSVEINNLDKIKTLTESVAKLVMIFSLLLSAANIVSGIF